MLLESPLLVHFQTQALLLQPLFMGQLLCQMMPFKFRQVLQVPQVLAIERALLLKHFLTIQSQSRILSNSFIFKLDPSFSETDPLTASMLDPIFSSPFAFGQKVDPFDVVAFQQFSDIAGSHIRRNSRHVDNASIADLLLILFEVSFVLGHEVFDVSLLHFIFVFDLQVQLLLSIGFLFLSIDILSLIFPCYFLMPFFFLLDFYFWLWLLMPLLIALLMLHNTIVVILYYINTLTPFPDIQNNLNPQEMDIDSTNFDPKRYVLSMLKQSTIKELIRKNNEIEEQIKVHDHQIQSLVFQNYSKFISSIDTVRQMKDNICLVDGRLKELDSAMDKISDLALKIDETFKFKRMEIQKLDTVNKDLQKLKNLCDFPNVLKQDLAEYKATHESKVSQSFAQGPRLFNKSIAVYQECYKTLESLKAQPLIEPIYKESVNRIEEVRSILRTRQVQFSKDHQNSNALRVVTKNLIVISDQQNQISVLRSYFHSWKERFIFKRKAQKLEDNEKYDKSVSLADLINNSKIPEMNEQFWSEFLREFSFLFDEIYPKLALNEELGLLLGNYIRQIFNWAITNELEQIIQYSSSMKAYVHANHYIAKNLKEALGKISVGRDDLMRNKLYVELSEKLTERIQKLGINMLNFLFGRLKLSFLEQLSQSKKNLSSMAISEDFLKDTYMKILAPIKEAFKNDFEPILNDLEHVQSSHEHIFSSDQNYHQAIHQQIESLILFLGYSVTLTPDLITQELNSQINKSEKIHKLEKAHIELAVKDFYETEEQNGLWFAVSHNYLNYLNNQLGKKIIESAHKRIQISQTHNYAHVFNFIKQRIGTNLLNFIRFYTRKIQNEFTTENIFGSVKELVQIVNSIFPDNRRSMLNKPSFLSEGNSKIHETELMTARKLRIIEKKVIIERSHILTLFIRRLLKLSLISLRGEAGKKSIEPNCLYCLVQICYEIGNVEEESQISAYYQLLLAESKRNSLTKQQLQKFYMETRKKYFQPNH